MNNKTLAVAVATTVVALTGCSNVDTSGLTPDADIDHCVVQSMSDDTYHTSCGDVRTGKVKLTIGHAYSFSGGFMGYRDESEPKKCTVIKKNITDDGWGTRKLLLDTTCGVLESTPQPYSNIHEGKTYTLWVHVDYGTVNHADE